MPIHATITATGRYAPSRVICNSDFEKPSLIGPLKRDPSGDKKKDTGTTARKVSDLSGGIKRRHASTPEEDNPYMAYRAMQDLIESKGLTRREVEEIDGLYVGTNSFGRGPKSDDVPEGKIIPPYSTFPSNSDIVKEKLGISCHNLDIIGGCPSWMLALREAWKGIASGMQKKIAVIGSDDIIGFADGSDRGNGYLFGNGAGAVLVEASDRPGFINYFFGDQHDSDFKLAGTYSKGVSIKFDKDGKPYGEEPSFQHRLKMDGPAVYKYALRTAIPECLEGMLANVFINESGNTITVPEGMSPPDDSYRPLTINDLEALFIHPANGRITNEGARKRVAKMGGERDIVYDKPFESHGNISAASVPFCLDTAIKEGLDEERRLKEGDVYGMFSFGSGFKHVGVLGIWNTNPTYVS